MNLPSYADGVPSVTTPQMIEVDRAMVEDYRIELIQMMENAGRNLAHLARVRFLEGNPLGKPITAIAGTGGNGGGAMVAARRLHGWGARLVVLIPDPDEAFTPIPAHQLDILRRMGVPVLPAAQAPDSAPPSLILDGLIGYSLRTAPRGPAADLIHWANRQAAPVLSLDVPSGVDAGRGTLHDPAIRATATMTLALPKEGLRKGEVAGCVGELYLADISVPPQLYESPALGLSVGAIFAEADVVRLR